jgi:hypothetical protein
MVEETPISNISRAKWIGGMAQVVERLLYKEKVLNQTPVPPEKRRQGLGGS